MKRTLTLTCEALAELTPEQMSNVVGAAPDVPTLPVKDCLDTMQPTRCLCP